MDARDLFLNQHTAVHSAAVGGNKAFPYNFEGSPLFGCFGSSFVGVDVTFREPTPSDKEAGMRSAKDGPLVEIALGVFSTFQGIYPRDDPATKTNGAGKKIRNLLIDARF